MNDICVFFVFFSVFFFSSPLVSFYAQFSFEEKLTKKAKKGQLEEEEKS